jgi:hypothetical protein
MDVPNQTAPSEKKEAGIQPMFTISVEDPQKVGDPIRAFTLYTVHTKVRFVRSEYRLSSTFLPDHFPSVFQAFVFCSSPLFGLFMAVWDSFDQ